LCPAGAALRPMATKLKLVSLDDPVLRQQTKKIRTVDADLLRLIDEMFEAMYEFRGVGLAAPQIGLSLRLAVIHVPEMDPIALINPEVVHREGFRIVDEGCLSVPGWRGEVKRSVTVTVKALNREGKQIKLTAKDNLLAEAFEHETDHLDGMLYIGRLNSPEKLWKLPPEEELEEEVEETEPEPPPKRRRPKAQAHDPERK